MLRRLSVRGKILAAIAVPVIVLFAAALFISFGAIQDTRVAGQTQAVVEALEVQDDAGTALASERGLAMLRGYGVKGLEDKITAARKVTDTALDRRDSKFGELDLSALDPRVNDAIAVTIADREQLVTLRERIDSDVSPEIYRTSLYTTFIDDAIDVQQSLADSVSNRDLGRYLQTYTLLDQSMAQDTLELPLVSGLLAYPDDVLAKTGESTDPIESAKRRVSLLVSQDNALFAETQQAVADLNDPNLSYPATSGSYASTRDPLSYANPKAVSDADTAAWAKVSTEHLNNLRPVRDQVRASSAEIAADDSSSATTTAVLTILITLAAIAGSILIAGFIGSRIVNPLRRLTVAAGDVRDQLPVLVEQVAVPGQGPSIDIAPITIESSDEVGQLANAFNDVNATTIRIAREQAALRGSIAEMFVNVARRDQVLLNRQLAFLDDLERSEEDPSTLSNLFRLDHLATRMRRNAESLLVLAGIDSGRRVRQPMPASDVIRTASSEIELYDRVRLNLAVDPQMLGHNALNAAHLLAELLENATMFSEPHTPVEVSISQDQSSVYITIRDHGLGMTPDEIIEATRKVRASAATDVVGAQRLGLFVVGRLADRLSARVSFAAGEGAGTEVTVAFPQVLFLAASAVPLPQPTDPLEASTQSAVGQLAAGPATAGLPVRGQTPATGPTTAVGTGTSSVPVVEDAPLVQAVDLDALTDGTTGVGMPRRRSRSLDSTASAPSASLASGPATGSIVLPPLAAPSLPDDLPFGDEAWAPPVDVAPAPAALPSRAARRAADPSISLDPTVADPTSLPGADLGEQVEIPVLEVTQRTAMFSSFRSMGAIGEQLSEDPHDFDAATADAGDLGAELRDAAATSEVDLTSEFDEVARPLTDAVPVVGGYAPTGYGDDRTWAPEPAATQPVAPVAAEQAWVPEQAWQPEQPVAQVEPTLHAQPELAEAAPQPEPVQQQPFAQQQVPVAPAVEQTATFAAVAPEPAQFDEPVADSGQFSALPGFEELMTDLPTRRSLRESTARRRGLFGRRPRTGETPVVASAPHTGMTPLLSGPAPQADAEPQVSRYSEPEPVGQGGETWTPAAAPVEPAPVAAPAAFVPEQAWQPEQQWAPEQPAVQPEQPFTPQVSVPAPEQTPAAWSAPAPLQRRALQEQELDRPIDSEYIRDSVEARSEWMASAVLYEEMNTLLRSSEFGSPTFDAAGPDEYRPTQTAFETPGLVRRGASSAPASNDPFTARIERDPEVLRSRLTAFQSGMSRGRTATQEADGSTWTGLTMNDVPDPTASSR